MQEEPESEDLEEAAHQYAWDKQEHHVDFDGDEYLDYGVRFDSFKAGAKWQFERVKEALLSEVLPCFMHGGEADEVVANLEEVLNQKK